MRLQGEVLNAAGQAIIATDPAGVVLSWDKAAEQMYGWSAAEATGQRVRDLIGPDGSVQAADPNLERLGRGQSCTGESWVKRREPLARVLHSHARLRP